MVGESCQENSSCLLGFGCGLLRRRPEKYVDLDLSVEEHLGCRPLISVPAGEGDKHRFCRWVCNYALNEMV